MKFEVRRRKRRFWVSGPSPLQAGATYYFWSDHKTAFYHGHYTLETGERFELWSSFLHWLPY